MTDEEFEAKVHALREAFKREMMSAVGDNAGAFSEDDEKFRDNYSMVLYASFSLIATLAGISIIRGMAKKEMSFDEAIAYVQTEYAAYTREAVDKGADSICHATGTISADKMKIMN